MGVGLTTAFGGWVPSDLWRFLPLAVFLTCFAEMVLLPTRFFFDSAISILLSQGREDTSASIADPARSFISIIGSRRGGFRRPIAICIQRPLAKAIGAPRWRFRND